MPRSPRRKPKGRPPAAKKARLARPKRTILAKPALARELGRSVRQLTEYRQRGLPQEADGRYCLEDCRAWIAANIKPTARSISGEMPAPIGEAAASDFALWNARKTQHQARQEKLKADELEGRLIDVDIPAREAERRIAHCRALFEQIPDRLLGILPRKTPAKIRGGLRDAVQEWIAAALATLADEAEQLAAAEAPPDAPAEDLVE